MLTGKGPHIFVWIKSGKWSLLLDPIFLAFVILPLQPIYQHMFLKVFINCCQTSFVNHEFIHSLPEACRQERALPQSYGDHWSSWTLSLTLPLPSCSMYLHDWFHQFPVASNTSNHALLDQNECHWTTSHAFPWPPCYFKYQNLQFLLTPYELW